MKTGFIGLGTMGSRMAANAVKAEFDVAVYDVRPEAVEALVRLGATAAASCADAARGAEVVEIAVPEDADVEAAMLGDDGVLAGAAAGSVVAIHSTVHPDAVRRLGAAAAEHGVGLVDAQMSGGQTGAEEASLLFMVGGDEVHVERCRPVLETLGKRIIHTGPLGTAATAKLCQQTIIVGSIIAVSEGMLLAKTAGLSPEALSEIVLSSVGPRQIMERWLDRFSQIDPHTVDLFYKGVAPALQLAHELGVSLPALAAGHQLLTSRFGGGRNTVTSVTP